MASGIGLGGPLQAMPAGVIGDGEARAVEVDPQELRRGRVVLDHENGRVDPVAGPAARRPDRPRRVGAGQR